MELWKVNFFARAVKIKCERKDLQSLGFDLDGSNKEPFPLKISPKHFEKVINVLNLNKKTLKALELLYFDRQKYLMRRSEKLRVQSNDMSSRLILLMQRFKAQRLQFYNCRSLAVFNFFPFIRNNELRETQIKEIDLEIQGSKAPPQ